MKNVSLAMAALALSSGAALAQYPLQGFLYNWDRTGVGVGVSVFSRYGINAEEHLTRVDRDDYRDWGLNQQGQVQVQGFVVYMLDTNDGTREVFSIVGYEEDAQNPNLPDLTNRRVNAGPYQMPPAGSPPGARAYRLYTTFAQPVTLANGGDLFFGTSVPALVSAQQPYDGLWTGLVADDPLTPGTPPVYDTPGPAGQVGARISRDTYACYIVNNVPTYIAPTATNPNVLEQFAIDLFLSGGAAGGVAIAQTNQTNYAASNAPHGTSNFLSGLHPDTYGFTTGRADDIGFAVVSHTSQVQTGSIALVMLALGPSPIGTLPVNQLFPFAGAAGTTGVVCIDFTVSANFFLFMTPGGTNSVPNQLEGQVIAPLTPSARTFLASATGNIDLWWQGFVINSAVTGPQLEVHATGCVVQKLK